MLTDNPMPPGAVSDALDCFERADRAYSGLPPWHRLGARAQAGAEDWPAVLLALVYRMVESFLAFLRSLVSLPVPA